MILRMFFNTILISILLQSGIFKVAGFQLSLVQYGNEESDLLFDRSTSRAFCFPSQEMMATMSDESRHHNWGYSSLLNYSISLERVGQVFCRQLGFSVYERIVPKEIEERREKILWAAECLGYEPSITHCVYEEITDPEINCTNFVGLKCSNCDNKVYTIGSNDTLVVTSPGFPNIYNDNSVCRWIVKKKDPSPFVVNIKFLSLPSRRFCTKGSLDIISRKEEASDYILHESLCGNLENKVILVNNSILDLRLQSGLFHPRPYGPAGFRLIVSILQDLQNKGREQQLHSMTTSEIVGITLGVAFMLILIIPLALITRYLIRRIRRTRRQRELAKTLHYRITPATPHMQTSIKMTPLPAVPKTGSKLFSTTNEGDRKSSICSGIYEDIMHARRSVSYLQLEDVNKKERESCDYNFQIPTFLFTCNENNNDSNDSKSAPSDIPSGSFTSDFDSVFGSDKNEMDSFSQPKQPVRCGTYTIVKTEKPSISRHSSPLTLLSTSRNTDLQNLGQRCFSESDAEMGINSDFNFNSLHKTYTQGFSPSKP